MGGARRPGRLAALLLAAGLLAGCRTIRVKPEAADVRVHFDVEAVRGCAFLGEVVGSEGHWYTYLFLANETMTTAALNDLRNKAKARGADAVFVPGYTLIFTTSVTILGQAYRCGR
jgi:hypothetical protein